MGSESKVELPKSYLIKRSNVFREIKKTNSPEKDYNDITISSKNLSPHSQKLKKGDVVYVAETRGGIYAKGVVIDNPEKPKVFERIKDVLEFCRNRNDESYWLDKIQLFNDRLIKDPKTKLRFHEYIIKQELLERSIPYNGPLKKYIQPGFAHTFIALTDEDLKFLKEPDYRLKNVNELSEKIPSDLRLKIYLFMNKNYSIGHLIDIDHFIPKNVGGPGNIIENLVPIGLSLNRYKSDSVPRFLFEVAISKNYIERFSPQEERIIKILKDNEPFITEKKSPECKDVAREITSEIKNWELSKARKFYLEVLKSFHPDYAELINEWKEKENK